MIFAVAGVGCGEGVATCGFVAALEEVAEVAVVDDTDVVVVGVVVGA